MMISADDYISLENSINGIKKDFGIGPTIEIKWSHYGSILKNNRKKVKHDLSLEQLIDYYSLVLEALCKLKSVRIFYSITDNREVKKVDELNLIKMHLQNSYQRAQLYAKETNTNAFIIADDLDEKTKMIKKAIFELSSEGDSFMSFDNVNKGMFVDYSDQCIGLQVTDICVGIFTANLKYYDSNNLKEKRKYNVAHNLFIGKLYQKIRTSSHLDVYGYGVKEVPNGAGKKKARDVSELIYSLNYKDLFIDN